MRIAFKHCAVIGLLAASPLAAQGQAVKVDAAPGKGWTHRPTGIELPALIAEVPRAVIADYSGRGWDIGGQYETAGRQTIVSLYVFESQVPDAAIAFESAQRAIIKPSKEMPANFLAQPVIVAPPMTFAPKGQPVQSGLKVVYSSTGTYKSSALALAAFGDHWLIKIRISSQVMSTAEVAQLLDRVIAEFDLPKDKVKQPVPASPIAPCPAMLGEMPKSKDMKVEKGQPLMNIVLGPASSDVGRSYDQGFDKPGYCRDAATAGDRAVYRQIGKDEAYIIPINDNGSAIHAERDVLAWSGGPNVKGSAPPTFNVYVTTPGSAYVFYPQDRLPPPQQAYDLISTSPLVVKNERTAKGDALDINPQFIP